MKIEDLNPREDCTIAFANGLVLRLSVASPDPIDAFDPFCDPRELKQSLLAKYSSREPKRFIQYDAFDAGTEPEIFSTETHELMNGSSVRVLIQPDLSAKQAARYLRKIAQVVGQDTSRVGDRK